MKKYFLLAIVVSTFLGMGCNLEKEIDIELPEYQSKLVVECYLEPGQPYALLLSRTSGYFDPYQTDPNAFIDELLEDSAAVSIKAGNQEISLTNQLTFNPFTGKLFNYVASSQVPLDTNITFVLNIETKNGELLTASTKILPVVPIDSVVVEFDEPDTLGRVLTYFTDPDRNVTNYFRRMTNVHSLDSIPKWDFPFDDRAVEGEGLMLFGTPYEYAIGDTVFTTLFHLDKDFYNFFSSVLIAEQSNGTPFSQPSIIKSNIQSETGAIGIFTGLSYERRMVIIE